MLVRELMTRSVEWTTATTTLADAARRMRDRNIGCLPVGEGDSFVGILTEKDFTTRATAEAMSPTTTTVSQIMTPGVICCHEGDTIEYALRTMDDKHIHHLPVLNQLDKVVGIVSLSDLALRGPQELYPDISKLAFQAASLTQTISAKLTN
jgi:CBS-domain-containing membrane protein